MKNILFIFIGLVTTLGFSKTHDFDEVIIHYSVYQDGKSHLRNILDENEVVVHDSVFMMVFSEEKSKLCSVSKDTLYVTKADNDVVFSQYIGNIIELKVIDDYVLIQARVDTATLKFVLFSLESDEIVKEIELETSHFHDFVGVNNLFLSYVDLVDGKDLMRIVKYTLPELSIDTSFEYSSVSWQHITMSLGYDDKLFIYESFSHKMFQLAESGDILSDTILEGAYQFVRQEQSSESNELFMESVDKGSLYQVNFSNGRYMIEELPNLGKDYLQDYHFLTESNVINELDTIYYKFNPNSYEIDQVIHSNITAYCMETRLATGIFSFLVKSEKQYVLTDESILKIDLESIDVYNLNGALLLRNSSKVDVSNHALPSGYYILIGKEKHDLKKYRYWIK